MDCEETPAYGVVVKASGEMSNNGEPMRRFVQNFVLVPQSPKEYKVHMDIFRYLDEVLCQKIQTKRRNYYKYFIFDT